MRNHTSIRDFVVESLKIELRKSDFLLLMVFWFNVITIVIFFFMKSYIAPVNNVGFCGLIAQFFYLCFAIFMLKACVEVFDGVTVNES